MGKHGGGKDGEAHPALEEALIQSGYEQETHWVWRGRVCGSPPLAVGAKAVSDHSQPKDGESSNARGAPQSEEATQPKQASNSDEKSQDEDTAKDEADSESEQDEKEGGPESPADRKARQRKRDKRSGWKEITVKAPKGKDARRLVTEFARIIFDKEIRAIMWSAVYNHELLLLGQKVDSLTGMRRLLVKWLLG